MVCNAKVKKNLKDDDGKFFIRLLVDDYDDNVDNVIPYWRRTPVVIDGFPIINAHFCINVPLKND